MDYIRDGGWAMWAIIITAIATAVMAGVKSGRGRSTALFAGSIIIVAEGVLGMGRGMQAVSDYVVKNPGEQATQILAVGLGELSHCGTFSVAVAMLLSAVGYFFHRQAAKAE